MYKTRTSGGQAPSTGRNQSSFFPFLGHFMAIIAIGALKATQLREPQKSQGSIPKVENIIRKK